MDTDLDREISEQGQKSIPRLSRLPVPLIATDTLKKLRPSASVGSLRHQACKSPSKQGFQRPPVPKLPLPLREGGQSTVRTIISHPNYSYRTRSPVRNALERVPVLTLDKTPPRSDNEFETANPGDENGFVNLPDEKLSLPKTPITARRRPRPSLSERTIESMSQFSPSPTPSRRRSSFVSAQSVMGPPPTPTNIRPKSRPSTAFGSRLPPSTSISSVYTPPKALVTDSTSRIARPRRERRTSLSNIVQKPTFSEPSEALSKPRAQTMRVKAKNGLAVADSMRSSVHQTPMPQAAPKTSGKADINSLIPRSTSTTPQATRNRETPRSTRIKASPTTINAVNGVLDLSNQPLDLAKPLSLSHTTIHTLRLSSTNLHTIPPQLLDPTICSTLQVLDLSHNPLSSTTTTPYLTSRLHLPNLHTLSLVSCGLTSVRPLLAYLDTPNLHTLNVSCNRLTGTLPALRKTYPNLKLVLATDNWITDVEDEYSTAAPASDTGVSIPLVLDLRNNPVVVSV